MLATLLGLRGLRGWGQQEGQSPGEEGRGGAPWGEGMGSPGGSEAGLEQSLRTTSYRGPGGSPLGLVLLTWPYFSPPSLPWVASPA